MSSKHFSASVRVGCSNAWGSQTVSMPLAPDVTIFGSCTVFRVVRECARVRAAGGCPCPCLQTVGRPDDVGEGVGVRGLLVHEHGGERPDAEHGGCVPARDGAEAAVGAEAHAHGRAVLRRARARKRDRARLGAPLRARQHAQPAVGLARPERRQKVHRLVPAAHRASSSSSSSSRSVVRCARSSRSVAHSPRAVPRTRVSQAVQGKPGFPCVSLALAFFEIAFEENTSSLDFCFFCLFCSSASD